MSTPEITLHVILIVEGGIYEDSFVRYLANFLVTVGMWNGFLFKENKTSLKYLYFEFVFLICNSLFMSWARY